MTRSTGQLLEQALGLDESERASLAGALIESLHPETDSRADEAWELVIERRVRELEAGTAATLPWAAVRARLFDGFE